MRHYSSPRPDAAATANNGAQPKRSDWATLKTLLPYLWTYKWRVSLALLFMLGAKLANVGVPLVLKNWWTA